MTQRVSWKDKAIVFTSNQNRHSLVRQETIADSGQQEDRDRSNTGPRGPSQQSFDSGIQNKSFSSSFGESFDTQKGLLESKNDASSRKARSVSAILKTFEKKTCTYYFENEKKPGFCKCGRHREHHRNETFVTSNVEWDIIKHVESRRTNTYGEVEFHGTNRKTRAKYIRLSNDTEAKDALKLLLKEWKLEFPNLLVSVTGGAKTFKLPLKLKQQFSNGLHKVAQTTGAWVITGGTNTGVMKHVGEALQVSSKGRFGSQGDSRKKVYCIGVATWGIVEHRRELTNTKDKVVKYFMTNSIQSEGACLDNNHTHFFLVDNGTVNRYGAEIKFRAQLEKQIMKMEVDKNRGKVPAVLLVLEGGPNTVLTVYEAISQDPVVPVVVIKDSGRAADLLAFAHNISQGEGPLYDMGDVVEHKQLLKRIEQTFPEMDQSGCLRVYANIIKCVEKKHLITIFKMEEGTADLDQAILTALLKSKSTSPEDQLKLALIWNRPDIARVQIFIDDLKWPLASLEDAMKDALEKDRTEFVELLLEHGVNMANFLTQERLEGLYSTRARKRRSMMRYFLGNEKCKSGGVRLQDAEDIFTKLTGLHLRHCEKHANSIKAVIPVKSGEKFTHPFNKLFIWAVLNNMQKMALCFLRHGEEAMAKALVACRLYFAMADYADKRELKDDIIEALNMNGQEFQRIAVQLLDQCFISEETTSSQLLTYELTNWGKTTNLTLAVSSGHTLFVAHSCSQELLTDIWGGVMTFRTLRSLKTVLCIFIPPLVFRLGFRTRPELRNRPQTEGAYEQFEAMEDPEAEEKSVEVDIEDLKTNGEEQVKFKRNSTYTSSLHESILSPSQRDVDAISSSEVAPIHPLKWWEKLLGFYTAPITKFWGNVIAYLIFLGLYTYTLLGKFQPKLSKVEIVVIIFVISLTTEEIRQVLKSDSGRFYKKVYEWGQSKWNLCDGLAIFLYYIGLILRLNESTMSAGRVIFAIDIMLWIIRLLDIFSVNQNLGPYVVMIGKMTIDLAYFLFIMAVFLLAYGVARQTILEPNTAASWKKVAEIFFVPYFQVYGELFIDKDKLYNVNTTYFGTVKHNQHGEPVVSLLMAFYLLVANILLLNLLIAIFNNTFTKVQANSNQIWKFQRYHLILEYARRPPFVPPFVFLNHVLSILIYIYHKCRQCECCGGHTKEHLRSTDRKIKFFPSTAELTNLMQFEEECFADYLRKKHDIHCTSKEERMRVMLERIDSISYQLEEAKNESIAREKTVNKKFFRLSDQVESMAKNITKELSAYETALSVDRENAPSTVNVDRRRQSEGIARSKILRDLAKPSAPKRFLSHNPYMHMEQYEGIAKVKEAAWGFRRSSLQGMSPTKERLMQALEDERNGKAFAYDGEDTVDAPPQHSKAPHLQNQSAVDEIEPFRERSSSCPHRLSFEHEVDPHQIEIQERIDETPEDDDTDGMTVDGIVDDGIPANFFIHEKARTSPYPASDINRFPVPDCYVSWAVAYPDYNPPEYTSITLMQSLWIDPASSRDLKFNSLDNDVNRISDFVEYQVVDGKPLNPFGRTGITGRGLFGRWGPNHALETIVTRWKRSPSGEKFERSKGSFSLEFLAMKRKEQIAIPGGMLAEMYTVPKVIAEVFKLNYQGRSESEEKEINDFFANGSEISKEFDDPRNTDNAWLETKVINYHDEDGKVTKNLDLEYSSLIWLEIDGDIQINSKSKEYLVTVAELRGAHL